MAGFVGARLHLHSGCSSHRLTGFWFSSPAQTCRLLIDHLRRRKSLLSSAAVQKTGGFHGKIYHKSRPLNKAYDIELIERELECGEDDIIVKNHMMGICGSDKSFYRGFFFRLRPPNSVSRRNFLFCWAMRAAAPLQPSEAGVSEYKVGDKVMAFGWNNNFADYFKSKAFQLQPVPEGLDMDIAAWGNLPAAPCTPG